MKGRILSTRLLGHYKRELERFNIIMKNLKTHTQTCKKDYDATRKIQKIGQHIKRINNSIKLTRQVKQNTIIDKDI